MSHPVEAVVWSSAWDFFVSADDEGDDGSKIVAYSDRSAVFTWRTGWHISGLNVAHDFMLVATAGSTVGSVFKLQQHDGAVVWTHDTEGLPLTSGLLGDDVFITAESGPDGLALVARDVRDGSQLWSVPFAASVDGGSGEASHFDVANLFSDVDGNLIVVGTTRLDAKVGTSGQFYVQKLLLRGGRLP